MPAAAAEAQAPPPAALHSLVVSLRQSRSTWILLLALALAGALHARTTSETGDIRQRIPSIKSRGQEKEPDLRFRDLHTVFPPLEDLNDRDRLWPPNLDKPLCDLRIFVYDLPSDLRLPEKTVSQCRWSAYNSELLLHRTLTDPLSPRHSPSNHPHRSLYTEDPAEADFFLIPLFPACYLFDCWVKAGWTKTERCGVDDEYIQPVMRYIREAHPHWNASGGPDHLLFHPMDFIDGYYTEASRAAMNASTYLVTVGDVRPAPYGRYFRSFRDLVIPSSTHLLNSYYLNPRDYVDELGRPLVEPRGAADPHRQIAAQPAHSDIFVPSPDEPYDLSLHTLWRIGRRMLGWDPCNERDERSTLAIFRGGVGTETDGERYALGIRSLLFPSDGNTSSPPFSSSIHPGFSSLPGFDIAVWSENDDYARRLARSKFGLAPPGYTLDTTRLYEYLAFGVVPVFLGTGPTAGQVLPFARDVDWSSFTLSIPRERAHESPQILARVGEDEYERLRRNVWEVGRKVVLEEREGNAWKLLARDLCRMKRKGALTPGPEIANN
ncbi:hypothetical protein Rhopal_001794-T1 [Rhodotorula paludigena]|uniref:Exostosin GT47 domain-containing protein n=1 Tax=Rhodotorula paludigena TaxID=86838 RepID=A0AAV5GJG4_9BASI|nr:hypothetical protein Rhopal_001794-T1 [Rhodotorula paludigena]